MHYVVAIEHKSYKIKAIILVLYKSFYYDNQLVYSCYNPYLLRASTIPFTYIFCSFSMSTLVQGAFLIGIDGKILVRSSSRT